MDDAPLGGYSIPRTADGRGLCGAWPVTLRDRPYFVDFDAVGFPTAIMWWRDRRPKAGFCKVCKYDLTGNVSGTCPECGTEYAKLSHAQ